MTSPRGRALVLGSDTHAFLSVIRSLGRAGIQVHVAWHEPNSPPLRSRYVFKAHDLPPYFGNTHDWKTALIALMQREAFDLVIPCHDQMFIPLQEHRQDLEPFGRLSLINDRAFDVLFDKFKTNELARSLGIPVPREVLVANREEADYVRATYSLPVVLKPPATFNARNLRGRREVRKAYSWEEFDRYLDAMRADGPVIVQENLLGEGVGVELLLNAGKLLLAFQHVRVHEPLHGGGSSYRKSVPVSPDLLEAALKLLQAVDYTGVAMVEFKVNGRTGAWALIEVNGRFWGSLPLALACGADFPLALYQLLVEGRTAFPQTYRVGLYCRSLGWDIWWQWDNLRADHSDPTLATRPLPAVLGETVRNVLTLRERSDTFTRDDPGPGFAEVREVMAEVWKRLSRRSSEVLSRRSLTERFLQLRLPRRWLQWRTRKALGRANTVLFVCHGNLCRSPFAEYLARRYFPDKTFLSAGYFPESMRASPANAETAAARWNVTLSAHRSRILTKELVRQADALLVFDYENYRQITGEFAFLRDGVHFVGALCRNGPLFIQDPVGKDVAYFERTFRQIAAALGALAGDSGLH